MFLTVEPFISSAQWFPHLWNFIIKYLLYNLLFSFLYRSLKIVVSLGRTYMWQEESYTQMFCLLCWWLVGKKVEEREPVCTPLNQWDALWGFPVPTVADGDRATAILSMDFILSPVFCLWLALKLYFKCKSLMLFFLFLFLFICFVFKSLSSLTNEAIYWHLNKSLLFSGRPFSPYSPSWVLFTCKFPEGQG